MLKQLLGAIGRIMMTSPERFIGFWERLALKNSEECTLRWWVIPLARLEGLVFVTLSKRELSGTQFKQFLGFLGLIGILAFLFPKQYINWGTKLVYEDSDQCEWRSWVFPFTRIIGAVYVLVGIRSLQDR